MNTSLRNMHLPLPAELHMKIKAYAKQSGKAATTLVREVVQQWVQEEQRRQQEQALQVFVEEAQGTQDDLDHAWEQIGVEHMVQIDLTNK